MVRKKLREKSSKQKAPIKESPSVAINPSALSRGQRKRLVNKTHVLAKKSLDVLSLLKENHQKQDGEKGKVENALKFDFKDVDKQKKKTKGAPKNQQKQNQLLYSEMQHFRSVISNEKVKEDPYDSVRQYLEARIQSQKM